MLTSGQSKEKKSAKIFGKLKLEYSLVAGLVGLTVLVIASLAFWPGQSADWHIWLQLVVAALVFGYVIGSNQKNLPIKTWTITAAIFAGIVFFASIFTGEFLNVLLAPLVVGAGLRIRNQNWIISLSLGAIGLVIIERIAFAAFNWNPAINNSMQGAVAAVIAISTIGLTVATFVGTYRREMELLEKEHEFNASEMIVAHEIQSSLMAPNEIETGNWSMAARSIPARDVGGDFYEYIPYLDRGIGGIAIGDVAGKGIPAALQMAVVRTLFRVEARRRIFPAETLNSVNVALQAERSFGMVTLLYAFVDPSTATLHLANAGHNYPVILNGTFQEMKLPGLPLGIDDSIEYQEKVMKIKPGTSIVFYTDGVVEAMNSEGEMYGFERMKDALIANQHLEPRLMVDNMMSEVANFTEGAPQSDDITVVVLHHHPQPSGLNETDDSSEGDDNERQIELVPATVAANSGESKAEEDDGLNWI